MKKILIAAAVVGAFAGAAQAQTNVTLYGVADVGLRFDRTTLGSFKSMTGGELAGSRFGLRGSEDLGRGLKANFMIEMGYNVDTGTTVGTATATSPIAFFNRTSYAGLSGSWGDARLGNDYSPHFRSWSSVDPFGAASVGSVGNKGATTAASSSVALPSNSAGQYVGGATRMTNAVFYDSPSMSGFKVMGAYKFGEGVTAATKSVGDAWSLAANYDNGPIKLVVANYQAKTSATVTKKDLVWGGSYDFRVAKIAAQVFSEKNDDPVLATSRNTRTTELGVTVPLGAFTIKAMTARYDDRTANAADASALGLGVDYSLSKRTTFYGRYARINNSAGAAMVNGGGMLGVGSVAADSSPSVITMGVNHRF